MTAPATTLRALRSRVREGQGADFKLDADIADACGLDGGLFSISLDALRELQRRVLPGWVRASKEYPITWRYTLCDGKSPKLFEERHPDERRAWLAAILSALISEAEAK